MLLNFLATLHVVFPVALHPLSLWPRISLRGPGLRAGLRHRGVTGTAAPGGLDAGCV